MAELTVATNVFAGLFDQPTIERLRALDWKAFEHFIQYVFERGGYTVQYAGTQYGQGVDLKLFGTRDTGGTPIAYVSVKHYQPPTRTGQADVNAFQGVLAMHGNANGYLVASGEFTQPSIDAAAKTSNLQLIAGNHLVRYITYLHGSRHRKAHGNPVSPVPFLRTHRLQRRSPAQTKYLVIANNKGGVGKTTTALNLGLALAHDGANVLLVDMDGQANLTRSLPFAHAHSSQPPSLGDYFAGACGLLDLVRPTQFERVWLLPSYGDLQLTDAGVVAGPDVELQFVADIHSSVLIPQRYLAGGEFDWVIIDTPSSMSLHTRVALAASHYIIAPAEPSILGDTGLAELFDTADAMRALVGEGAQVLGCVITRWQNTAGARDAARDINQNQLLPRGIRLFTTKIPHDANVEKAHRNTEGGGIRDLLHLNPSKAGAAYRELLKEVLSHVNNS